QLLGQDVRLGGVAAAEDGAGLLVDEADLVSLWTPAAEVGAVAVVDEGEDAPADRHARLPRMSRLFPGVPVGADLLRLLDVERLAGLVVLERRALQVHAELRRPRRGRVRARAP